MTRHRELTDWISAVSGRWLGDTSITATLQASLKAAVPEVAPHPASTGYARPLLFPLLYHRRPRLTSALFHQVVDACQEARRTGRPVCIVGAAVGRGEPDADATRDLATVCGILNDCGWPVDSVGDVGELAHASRQLTTRARHTSYTRRASDLPDLLVATAYDVLGASAVYLSEGVTGGRCIGRLPVVAPLGRLHTPGDPFASPPPDAKLRPAGYDQIWGAAFTLGATHATGLSNDERGDAARTVHQRLNPTWRALVRAGMTAHHGVAPADTRRVVASGERRAAVTIPLFGARVISAATRALVETAAALATVTLVVDDITPPLLYRSADPGAIRTAFRNMATAAGGTTSFLSDLEPAELHERLRQALETLTMADLAAASPHGKPGRAHATFSGYDAIHLAIMAVACGGSPGTALAAQAANVPAVRALSRSHGITSLIVRSGPAGPVQEHEYRLAPAWLPLRTQPGDDYAS